MAILWEGLGKGPRPNFLLVWTEDNLMRESGKVNPFLGPPHALGGPRMVLALSNPHLTLS